MSATMQKRHLSTKSRQCVPFSAAAAAVLLFPAQASAHLVNTEVGVFYAGMTHPLTSAEHLLPTVALALVASQWGKRAGRFALLTFPVALLAGALAGSILPPVRSFQLASLFILGVLGGMLGLGERLRRVNPIAMGVIALLTGTILGYRSGNDMAASQVAGQFLLGVGLTGLLIVALVAAWVPQAASRPWRILRTAAGAGFAATGLVLLVQLVTGPASTLGPGAWIPGQEDLLGRLRSEQLTLTFVLGTLLAAMAWGAGHALTPGHGKAIVAAYLIGAQSTPWHAIYLGLTVTLTHTLGVFALGLVALFASWYILPEQLYPWLGAASGMMVVVLGSSILWRRLRIWIGPHKHDHPHHDHDGIHEHVHDCADAHAHIQGHSQVHQNDRPHSHGHPHLPPEPSVSWRYLLGLGVSGGLFPCPSALVLLLAAVSINRAALGMALVVAFSLGLAGVLTTVGLFFVKGGRILQRLSRMDQVGKILPAASAVVIIGIGIWLTTQAISMIQIQGG